MRAGPHRQAAPTWNHRRRGALEPQILGMRSGPLCRNSSGHRHAPQLRDAVQQLHALLPSVIFRTSDMASMKLHRSRPVKNMPHAAKIVFNMSPVVKRNRPFGAVAQERLGLLRRRNPSTTTAEITGTQRGRVSSSNSGTDDARSAMPEEPEQNERPKPLAGPIDFLANLPQAFTQPDGNDGRFDGPGNSSIRQKLVNNVGTIMQGMHAWCL